MQTTRPWTGLNWAGQVPMDQLVVGELKAGVCPISDVSENRASAKQSSEFLVGVLEIDSDSARELDEQESRTISRGESAPGRVN